MRALVTAGPTREPLDPVRYLTNRSSGRMGYAIAAALKRRGWDVLLVSGPTDLQPPLGVDLLAVETAREMLSACRSAWPDCHALFGVAAVADYRPARRSRTKLKKGGAEETTLDLVRNPDILASLARHKGDRLAVGFALETGVGRREALRKLREKRLDFIALNGPSALDAPEASLVLIDADGAETPLGPLPKGRLATAIVRTVLHSPRMSQHGRQA